jgi:hypothetical protein
VLDADGDAVELAVDGDDADGDAVLDDELDEPAGVISALVSLKAALLDERLPPVEVELELAAVSRSRHPVRVTDCALDR